MKRAGNPHSWRLLLLGMIPAAVTALLFVAFSGAGERATVAIMPAATPAVAEAATPLQADAVLVEKGKRRLSLLSAGRVLKSYPVALGGQPAGPKRCRGDNRTPEGRYVLDYRNAGSKFYLAIHISYPNAEDVRRAKALGCHPGGEIMIHGLPKDKQWAGRAQSLLDWTEGCIAVSNREMEEIWNAVADGTPIEIRP